MKREVHLTSQDLKKVPANGLTFHGIAGCRFRCNQLPHLGALNRSQMEAVRALSRPRSAAPIAPVSVPVRRISPPPVRRYSGAQEPFYNYYWR
jgi:hypothetical protein